MFSLHGPSAEGAEDIYQTRWRERFQYTIHQKTSLLEAKVAQKGVHFFFKKIK